jgi:allophanate hydrolase subunit 2
MGYRLKGGPSGISVAADRPSAPACIGTVQLPAGGEPIVLLCDGPTVGGYARIGVVATADVGQLAQRRPGEVVRFQPIDLTEARQALREQEALLDWLEGGA